MRGPALAGAIFGLAGAVALAGCGGSGAPRTAPVARAVARVPAPDPETQPLPPGDLGAWVRRPAILRSSPGGPVVTRLRAHTQFGSPLVLPIVRRSGRWVGVVSTALADGRVGWVRLRAVTLVREPVRIRVDLDARRLSVLRGRRTVLDMTVAVGGPATPTPPGLYGVTDLLRLEPGSAYGCCVVALSGHQPNVPQGWTGGDRLAVHGTSDPGSVGEAVSHGCLRAYDSDLRRLIRLATLGARVEVRA